VKASNLKKQIVNVCLLFWLTIFVQDVDGKAPGQANARAAGRASKSRLQATHANVKYGAHQRHRLDFYQAKSDQPTPLVVYIHGGGFRGGAKTSVNQKTLRELLDAGVSVAAIEYRLVPTFPLPTAHRDSLRALQYIRSQAIAWNIDKRRIGAFGGSAGAQICMWLAFHDEMADPSSQRKSERESSRLKCVATNGGQTTMDFKWWMKNIPAYTKPHRPRSEYFGAIKDQELARVINDISAQALITADDPPIWMSYGMAPNDPLPSDPRRIQGWQVHHVTFGIKLKEMMDSLGLEAHLRYPGKTGKYASIAEFFIAKLAQD
jgi:acetyl esterase